MAKMKHDKTFEVDEMGAIRWKGYTKDDVYQAEGHDPVKVLLRDPQMPPAVRYALIGVHDSMKIAREIAISIFGHKWPDHVMEVYDRYEASRFANEKLK
jgi:hypothetical protein